MADRSFADRLVLPVTAAIYRNGEEKPAMRWSFEMGIGGESDKMLLDFIFPLEKDLESPIGLASLTNRNIPVHKLLLVSSNRREERLH